MKYGIRDGMLKVPLEETFRTAADIGFDGVNDPDSSGTTGCPPESNTGPIS